MTAVWLTAGILDEKQQPSRVEDTHYFRAGCIQRCATWYCSQHQADPDHIRGSVGQGYAAGNERAILDGVRGFCHTKVGFDGVNADSASTQPRQVRREATGSAAKI